MENYKIVVFEGNEATGKSSLKKQFEVATNFKHLCVDRMFITSIVYNQYKNRHPELKNELLKDLEIFIEAFNPLFVVLKVDEKEQEKRFLKRGDWYIRITELREIEKNYDEVLKDLVGIYPQNFLILQNNTEEDQVKNVEKIIEKI